MPEQTVVEYISAKMTYVANMSQATQLDPADFPHGVMVNCSTCDRRDVLVDRRPFTDTDKGQLEFFTSRGWTIEPTVCPRCRGVGKKCVYALEEWGDWMDYPTWSLMDVEEQGVYLTREAAESAAQHLYALRMSRQYAADVAAHREGALRQAPEIPDYLQGWKKVYQVAEVPIHE